MSFPAADVAPPANKLECWNVPLNFCIHNNKLTMLKNNLQENLDPSRSAAKALTTFVTAIKKSKEDPMLEIKMPLKNC